MDVVRKSRLAQGILVLVLAVVVVCAVVIPYELVTHNNISDGVSPITANNSNLNSTITSSWSQVADLPKAEWENGAAELNGLVYSVGGSDMYNYDWSAVFAYNTTTNTWTSRANLTLPRRYHGTTTSGGYIYVCGGYYGQTVLNTAARYDPTQDTWTQIPSMTYPRQGLTATALSDGQIYCIGGDSGEAIVEIYNPITSTWAMGASPTIPRQGHAAVASLDKNFIYIFGGYSSTAGKYLTSLEVYSLATQSWKQLSSMNIARFAPGGAIDLNGYIYALGGNGIVPCDGSVERYDPSMDVWSNTSVPAMANPRAAFGAVRGGDGKIYVFGGQCNYPILNSTEALTV